jgi:hypothetical protein
MSMMKHSCCYAISVDDLRPIYTSLYHHCLCNCAMLMTQAGAGAAPKSLIKFGSMVIWSYGINLT